MCMEDIRIGRRIARNIQRRDVDTSVILIVDRNESRVSLEIYSSDALGFTIGFDPAIIASVTGLQNDSTRAPFRWNIRDHGQIVYGPIYAVAPALTRIVVIEGTLDQK